MRFELAESPTMAEREVWLTRPQYENRIANATQAGIDITLRIVAEHLKEPVAVVKRHCYDRAGLSTKFRP